ncbi:serine carboxypeptidase [Colletotrichum navitas]|uniref:Serine carboxypeptidase n=1 Tax=Colletotrichum navitas TaxID=681940 RepID=A0AAD8PWP4_9PEZI|nr:serine carboxypeptidase [Colletotrichum navitas]KAK1585434.1 serine carboxypeptidase [Colletotrichum navitas]
MKKLSPLAAWAAAVSAIFNSEDQRGLRWGHGPEHDGIVGASASSAARRPQAKHAFLTDKTSKFAVNGTGIPNVGFDAGESYAGLLPIDAAASDDEMQELYFWFFPKEKPSDDREIVIWLTGGPGCSSIGELLQENGPISWKPGTRAPVRNPWSWHRLANVVWVDQPVGTGYSRGPVTATDEHDVARQFLGFWRNFVDAFDLHGYKVYVAGSSYSGLFTPYISSAMLDAAADGGDAGGGGGGGYFDVGGMMVLDPLLSQYGLGQDFAVSRVLDYWGPAFSLNETAREAVREIEDRCGYRDYVDRYLVFPPSGVQPVKIPGSFRYGDYVPECDALTVVIAAERVANPCFSVYNVLRTCPLPFDPLGFSEGTGYYPAPEPVYFDRPDVKEAIHAPPGREWQFCSRQPVFVGGVDGSQTPGPGSLPVIPGVVERTGNVIVGHGLRDLLVQSAGTLMAIQNMTWGGALGFQSRPEATLRVPHHRHGDAGKGSGGAPAGAGELGVWHSERGLTYFETPTAGHFLGRDAPSVSFRALEVLLGKVADFGSDAPFTTDAKERVVLSEEL